jgi:hypothetical protein
MRWGAIATGLALGCAALAGCGEGETRDRMVAAFERIQGDSTRGEMLFRADSVAEGRFLMRGELIASADGTRGRFSGTYREAGQSMSMRMIINGARVWMSSPQLDGALPPGKRWVAMRDPEAFAGSNMTPDMFRQLLEEADEIEELGTERVDGRRAERLQAEIDLDELAGKAEDEGEPAAAQLARFVGDGEAVATVDTWIGPGDLPIRFRAHVRMPRPGGGRDQVAVCEMTMDEYGVPVDASAPPLAVVAPESVLD